ncbi:MAG TPA: ribosome silencing factor [Anaerolineaceae bacterium]|nr:ribosome silencing factor [Anaerolineaceae bacterium]
MNFLEEKKAEKIVLLDLRELTTFTDYFILCNGTSDRMLQALATTLREYVKKDLEFIVNIEGESRDGWLVADLEDIVVHLFSPELRNYYKLEQLWGKAKTILTLQ